VFDAPSSNPGASAHDANAAAPPHAGLGVPALAGLGGAVLIGAIAVAVAVGGIGGGTSLGTDDLGGSDDPGVVVAAGTVVVDVAGAVARPGVYHLAGGARVGDAVAAAGGFGPRVDASRVSSELNLAAIVHDGERIVVPSRDDAPVSGGGGSGGASAKPGLVDLNHATEAELDALPGIGPVTAGKIVAAREETPFRAVDELRSRGLVGEKTFEKLKTLVTVG
jgi:competence protein ComEA